MKSFVYVISGDGRQKIGSSDNPKQRIKDLQTGCPYQLKFEFIGEVENGAAGQVEVDAQFTLHQHKAPGGDEWFVVPSDVAMTAVMASAHRLGYRIKPVDPDRTPGPSLMVGRKRPLWLIITMLPFYGAYIYWVLAIAGPRMDSGEMLQGSFVIEAVVFFSLLMLAQLLVRLVGNQLIATVRATSAFIVRVIPAQIQLGPKDER
jgi:hypothetical protein